MKTGTSGGLWGKARNVHHRDRAERGFAELLVEEYLEPEPVLSGSGAFAPIRGRSEFLPSVFELEESDMRTGMQLEFPLAESDGEVAPGRRVVWSTEEEQDDPDYGVLRIVVEDREAGPSEPTDFDEQIAPGAKQAETCQADDEPKVLRLPRRARANMPLGWSHQAPVRKSAPLTIRGFVTGCLIGGVAAAAALTVLSIAVR